MTTEHNPTPPERPLSARIESAEAEENWGEAMRLKLQRLAQSQPQPLGRPEEEREQIARAEEEGRWFEARPMKLAGWNASSETTEVGPLADVPPIP